MGQHGFAHGHVDQATLPGPLRVEECRQNAHHGGHRAAEQVADLQIGNRRLAPIDADLIEHTGKADIVEVVSGRHCQWAGLAIAGDRAIDDLRIDRPQRFVTNSQLVAHPRPEALDDDVGSTRQTQEYLTALRLLEVEPQPTLVAVDAAKEDADAVRTLTHDTCVVAGRVIFDLDDVGAQIGQMQSGDRTR